VPSALSLHRNRNLDRFILASADVSGRINQGVNRLDLAILEDLGVTVFCLLVGSLVF
jgi:hypothetical protein